MKMKTSHGAAELIKVITLKWTTSGGAAVKKANKHQVVRKISIFKKKMMKMKKKINEKIRINNNSLRILDVNVVNSSVI